MGDAHDAEPVVAAAFADADAAADARGEDLAAAAGNGVQAGVAKPADNVADVHAEEPLELDKLRRREGVDMHTGEVGLDIAEQLFVVFDGQAVVHAALKQNLCAVDRDQFPQFPADLLVAQCVGIRLAMVAPKGAEGAFGRADVGVVDVAGNDVGSVRLRVQPLGDGVRPGAQIVQRGILVQFEGLGIGQTGFAFDHGVDVERESAHELRQFRKAGRVGEARPDDFGEFESFGNFVQSLE